MVRKVSTAKLLPLSALPPHRALAGNSNYMSHLWHHHPAPSPLPGQGRRKTGFPFPSPPSTPGEAEGSQCWKTWWRGEEGLGGWGCPHTVVGETEAQEAEEVESLGLKSVPRCNK